ncbi:DUF4154 domain-containing protein [bacterium]|nr:DUF4154 domain-containing protein [bacterium]
MKHIKMMIPLLFLSLVCSSLNAQTENAPANIVSAMIVKVIAFEKNISSFGDITIYVLDAPDVAEELRKAVGMSVGESTLKDITSGKTLPSNKPSMIYFDDASQLNGVIEYTHQNKILSATGHPDLVDKGVTLGFGIGEDNKPKIFLNLNGSLEEGLDWNPAILKIAKTVKE